MRRQRLRGSLTDKGIATSTDALLVIRSAAAKRTQDHSMLTPPIRTDKAHLTLCLCRCLPRTWTPYYTSRSLGSSEGSAETAPLPWQPCARFIEKGIKLRLRLTALTHRARVKQAQIAQGLQITKPVPASQKKKALLLISQHAPWSR